MALDATTVLEVRLTGSDTNGGGFVPGTSGGVDYSQQDSAQISVTDGVTAGTTTITSATAAFPANCVGNLAYIAGGTGSITGAWYQIITRNSATSITVDRSTGLTTGTGVTINVGGALGSPGKASALVQNSGKVFIKYNASPYVITTATYNVSGGCCQPADGSEWTGYDTTRAFYVPYQNRPTIKLGSGVSSATMFQNLNALYRLQSVILDANLQTGSTCFQSSGECFYVKGMNFTVTGLADNTTVGVAILCEVTGGSNFSNTPLGFAFAYYCVSHDNIAPGINVAAIQTKMFAYGCISYNNNQDGFGFGTTGHAVNCTSYNNGGRGYYLGNVGQGTAACVNCVAEGNGSYGYFVNTGIGALINCADYNNTSGRKNTASLWLADVNPINGSGSFFNNAAGGDFGLNNTAGGGASARAAGFPGASGFPALPSTISYADIGAVQHQDAGGSSGPIAQLRQFNRGAPY